MELLRTVPLAVWAVCLLAGAQQETSEIIEGKVFYEDGRPAKGATAYAVPIDRPLGGIVPHAETDEAGYFAIRELTSGKYAVAAEKEDEGYPDMSNSFYSDGKLETVILTIEHPRKTVAIELGPKAGILMGTVTDSVTAAPLNPCVELRRTSKPNYFLMGTGLVNAKYRLLLPSNTDITMKVWLQGYEAWYYPGTANRSLSKPVFLRPGEGRTLDIALHRSRSRSAGCGMPVGTTIGP